VPTGLIAFQPFQSIPGRDDQILQAPSGVNQFELTLNYTPEVFGNPPGRSGISLAEQVDGAVIGERLNHRRHITRLMCNEANRSRFRRLGIGLFVRALLEIQIVNDPADLQNADSSIAFAPY
jgi:hypothetical protein